MKHFSNAIRWALAAGAVLAVAPLQAVVKLPLVISSHMVLQRDIPVPIWGTAAPDEKVTVKFRGQEKSATADAQGRWLVKLDPLAIGDGQVASMTIEGSNKILIEDVLVGEVWVGSGQSNMQMPTASYTKNDPVLEKLAAGNYPTLRLIKENGQWQPATPQNIQAFSALHFSFGVRLHQNLKVPVGLLVGAVGGTPSGYWLSESAYAADAACKEVVAKYAQTYSPEAAQKKYESDVAAWEKAVAAAKAKGDQRLPRKPTLPAGPGKSAGKIGNLYEVHIRPYLPFAIRGVLWDQGESGTAITGVDQYTLMGALIRGWRKEWGQGDFPFIYIQKPSGMGCAYDPADPVTDKADAFAPLPPKIPADGQYRENHIRIMDYPNTAMAISSDLGRGIHPTNKSGYGSRACRVALGLVYKNSVEYYGPIYQSHKVEDGKIRLTFTHTGQGLIQRHSDKLQGFAVAGADKVFHWAEAVIDGNTVVLTCAKVPKPEAVRYAWANSHPYANLFNKDGLPAIPFRTDSW